MFSFLSVAYIINYVDIRHSFIKGCMGSRAHGVVESVHDYSD